MKLLRNLWHLWIDDGGSVGLETLLLLAAVALPLLGLLIRYRQDIANWLGNKWNQYRGEAMQDTAKPPDSPPA